MNAAGELGRALLAVIERDERTPCADGSGAWVSDDATVRAEAARQCHGCPIEPECLAAAIEGKHRHGVWGGRDLSATPRREANR